MTNETRPPTRHINPFGLRMQPELRAQIEAAARANGRSLNAEIVARLAAPASGTELTAAALRADRALWAWRQNGRPAVVELTHAHGALNLALARAGAYK